MICKKCYLKYFKVFLSITLLSVIITIFMVDSFRSFIIKKDFITNKTIFIPIIVGILLSVFHTFLKISSQHENNTFIWDKNLKKIFNSIVVPLIIIYSILVYFKYFSLVTSTKIFKDNYFMITSIQNTIAYIIISLIFTLILKLIFTPNLFNKIKKIGKDGLEFNDDTYTIKEIENYLKAYMEYSTIQKNIINSLKELIDEINKNSIFISKEKCIDSYECLFKLYELKRGNIKINIINFRKNKSLGKDTYYVNSNYISNLFIKIKSESDKLLTFDYIVLELLVSILDNKIFRTFVEKPDLIFPKDSNFNIQNVKVDNVSTHKKHNENKFNDRRVTKSKGQKFVAIVIDIIPKEPFLIKTDELVNEVIESIKKIIRKEDSIIKLQDHDICIIMKIKVEYINEIRDKIKNRIENSIPNRFKYDWNLSCVSQNDINSDALDELINFVVNKKVLVNNIKF